MLNVLLALAGALLILAMLQDTFEVVPLPGWLPPGGITRIAAPDRRATIDRLTSTPAGSRADQDSLSSFHEENSEP